MITAHYDWKVEYVRIEEKDMKDIDDNGEAKEIIDACLEDIWKEIDYVSGSEPRLNDGKRNQGIRTFDTGANRNREENKLDYEGFLSPLVLKRYAQFLDKHRYLENGTLRDSDNWQKGIPLSAYMKSMWRHFMTVWTKHRAIELDDGGIEEALCAVIFNASGYLHELLKHQSYRISEDREPIV